MLPEKLKHAFQYCSLHVSPILEPRRIPLIAFSSYFATGEGMRRGVFVHMYHLDETTTKEQIYECVHEKIVASAGTTAYFMQYPDLIVDVDYIIAAQTNNEKSAVLDALPQTVKNILIEQHNKQGRFYMSFSQELFLDFA